MYTNVYIQTGMRVRVRWGQTSCVDLIYLRRGGDGVIARLEAWEQLTQVVNGRP